MNTKYYVPVRMLFMVLFLVAARAGTAWAGTITAAEYYIDVDPGQGSGTALSAKDGSFDSAVEDVTISLNTSSLTIGVHNLFIRMKNDAGVWGTPRKIPFNIDGNQYLAAEEYFIDTDPGAGSGAPLTAVDGAFDQKREQGSVVLNTSSLTAGLYTLYVRAKNAEGHWGTPRQYTIEIANQPVMMAMEYYMDTDPGKGNGTTMTSLNGSFSTIKESGGATQNTTNLSYGNHTIYARSENSFSIWGSTKNVSINVVLPPIPIAPTLTSPSNSATNQSLSLSLTWNAATGASTYRVQLSTDSNFSSTIVNDSTLTSATKAIGPLSTSSTYYWRVNARNDGGTSAWSETWRFTAVPPASGVPILVSPSNSATDQPISLSLTWNTIAGASTYRLQLSTSSSFSSTIVDDTSLTSATKTIGPLSNNTCYYWRVNARNTGGTSAWASAWSFTTIVTAPSAPVLSSPANAATGVAINPALCWNKAASAASYRIQVSAVSDFSSFIKDSSGVTDTTLAISGLTNNTTCYWRINATNVGGTSTWVSAWSFTTIVAAPSVPVLSSPVNAATGVAINPMLLWNKTAGAVSYRIQVLVQSESSSVVKDSSGITDTILALTGLTNNTIYYWHVKATNAGGASNWSPTFGFTTIVSLPSSVMLLTPFNMAGVRADSVLLTWGTATQSVTKYYLQVATDSGMSGIFFQDSTISDTTKLLNKLASNVTYWWRVKAYNAAGWGAYSSVMRFAYAITSVLPRQFELRSFSCNGYGNVLRYALPFQCYVSLKYYDMRGRVVASFVNQTRNAGYYSLPIPISQWARGMYIQVFEAGNFIRKGPVFIMR
jgi:hypothetical protein